MKVISIRGKYNPKRIIKAFNSLKEVVPLLITDAGTTMLKLKLNKKQWEKLNKISGGKNFGLAIKKIIENKDVDRSKAIESYLNKIKKGEKMKVFKEITASLEVKDFKRFNIAEFYEKIDSLTEEEIEKLKNEVLKELENNKNIISLSAGNIDLPFVKAISNATGIPVGTILKKTLEKYDEIEKGLAGASTETYKILKVKNKQGDISFYLVNDMFNYKNYFDDKNILGFEKIKVRKIDYDKDLINLGFFLIDEKIVKAEQKIKNLVYKIIDYSYNDLTEGIKDNKEKGEGNV